MKHAFAWLMPLALMASPALTEEGPKMTEDEKAVQAVAETMTAAFQEGRTDDVMAAYEPGAMVVFEPGLNVTDHDQLAAMFAEASGINPTFTYAGHEVFVVGDIGIHIAPWKMTGRLPDGTEVGGEGLSVAVMRQQADGTWRMVFDNPHAQVLLDQARAD